MKKNIIIGLLAIISIGSLLYGHHQKVRADEQEALANENAKMAQVAESRAQQQMIMADSK